MPQIKEFEPLDIKNYLLTISPPNVIIQTINILEGDINDLLYRYYKLEIKHF